MPHPRRILLIRPSALGDVARSVPLLASLRAALPDARVDWLIQDTFAPLIEPLFPHARPHQPALPDDRSRILPFPRRALAGALRAGRLGPLRHFLASLRAPRYDAVIDAQGLARSALFALATGAPIRIGDADAREAAPLAYSHRVRSDAPHTVDRMLALLGPLNVPPLHDMRLALEPTQPELSLLDPTQHDPTQPAPILIAPTSRWPAKRWPPDRFAELARRLLARTGRPIALVGGPGERDQCGPLLRLAESDPRVRDLIGRTDVRGLARAIASASLVIACDSAAAHIAVGFGRPLVALYGPTDTARVGPYSPGARVISHARPGDTLNHKDPAQASLMARITVEETLDHALAALADPSQP